jgi:O-antigen/teichoic acid export membrane protein
MAKDSRTKNSKRNIISGLIRQGIGILLPFFIRTAVLYLLGELYVGVGSLFNSILHVLNLADLGFSTAVIYALYKPVSDENWDAVSVIINYLKRIYRIVGFIILGTGLALLPFLEKLIAGDLPQGINIYILYVIYLSNSVISYFFFAYKSALLTAMQRDDVVSNTTSIITIFTRVTQLIILLFTRNYYLYISILPIGTIINNILYQYWSKKLFPWVIPKGELPREIATQLSKQIKGVVFNKIGDVARNSFDNIILSSLLGLATVAIYNNYYYIFSAVYGVVLVIINAVQASVGNSIATETVEKNYNDLRTFTFVFTWFTGWCTVCMFALYQPFMFIWMRGNQELIFPNIIMTLFCIYFYGVTMNNTRNLYLNGKGLFWECRVWYIVEAFGNLALNIILGIFWGVVGVLLATIITIFLFNFLCRNIVLFREYFKRPPKEFYLDHAVYAVTTIITCFVTTLCVNAIPISGVYGLFVRIVICIVIPNVVFLLCYCKNPNFKSGIALLRRLIRRN